MKINSFPFKEKDLEHKMWFVVIIAVVVVYAYVLVHLLSEQKRVDVLCKKCSSVMDKSSLPVGIKRELRDVLETWLTYRYFHKIPTLPVDFENEVSRLGLGKAREMVNDKYAVVPSTDNHIFYCVNKHGAVNIRSVYGLQC